LLYDGMTALVNFDAAVSENLRATVALINCNLR
jgi:hypothetical protein